MQAPEQSSANTYYTCPMHPDIQSDKPGTCPICHMDLVPATRAVDSSSNDLLLSDQQIQLANIKTDTINVGAFGSRQILPATLNFDLTKSLTVSARAMGRIEKLYIKTIGDSIRKGAPLYELYSEELNNAKQEYLLAIERKKIFTGEQLIDLEQLLLSARNKLQLWGLSNQQINALATSGKSTLTTTIYSPASGYLTDLRLKEGDYAMEGGAILTISDLSSLWAEAQVFTSQLSGIHPKSEATVQLPDFPGKSFRGSISFINPEIDPSSRIHLLRVVVPNKSQELRPGMAALVVLKEPIRKSMMLPIDAVIRERRGATVWVSTGKNTFQSRMVRTGIESEGFIEILSGLTVGEIVVISGTYLLQSEYVFKHGSDPMSGHQH